MKLLLSESNNVNMTRFSYLLLLSLFTSCSVHNPNSSKDDRTDTAYIVDTSKKTADTSYIPSGFYFVAEDGKGINKRLEKSNDVYTISPVPFASAKNAIKAELKETTHTQEGDYTDLCITFDDKGTKDLAAGTGNILHPKIAVVIANRLLYVVDNKTSIKTGIMNIALGGYSEQEMEAMCNAVNNKR